MHPARLFIVSGLPGSGKTTRAVELAERFNAQRMSADDVMSALGIDIWDALARASIERFQSEQAARLLRTGCSVVIEWGSWTRSERDELRVLGHDAGAICHLEFLDAPVDELWERVRTRDHERHVGSRAITREDMSTWNAQIERPSADELNLYDHMPPVRAGTERIGPTFPYGTWQPT